MVQFNTQNGNALDLAILSSLVADRHNANGGTSMSLVDAQEPTKGFMVSLAGFEHKIYDRDLIGFNVRQFIANNAANAKRLNAGPLFVGTWYDANYQLTYLDLSINIADKGTALQVGRSNKQLAIYDVANREAIAVEGLD